MYITWALRGVDRKSTRLNSSHANISYAVFCLNKDPNGIIVVQWLLDSGLPDITVHRTSMLKDSIPILCLNKHGSLIISRLFFFNVRGTAGIYILAQTAAFPI